jgi:hypothetical protein
MTDFTVASETKTNTSTLASAETASSTVKTETAVKETPAPPVHEETIRTEEKTSPTKTEKPVESSAETKTESKVEQKTEMPRPTSITNNVGTICPSCKGKGKIYQAEIRKNKMVTKDISNGIGPRNFVTYQVNEIVRPAGNVQCGRCGGTGKMKE